MRESIAADHPFVLQRAAAGRRPRVLRRARPAVQGRDPRRPRRARRGATAPPMPPTTFYRARPVHRPVPGPARREHRQDRPVQAARRRRRVLARRREAADAPAHLRHGLGDPGGARPVPVAPRGGEEARPPPARCPARPVQLPRRHARAPRSGIPRAGRSTGRSRTRCASSRRRRGYQEIYTPPLVQPAAVASSPGHWDLYREQHVPGRVRGPDLQPQADELPGVDVHLPIARCARTATCRCACPSTAGSTATSCPAHARGLTRVRHFVHGRRPHLRPAGPAIGRDRGAARRGPRGVRRGSASSRRFTFGDAARTRRSATRRCGSEPRRSIREALERSGVTLPRQGQGRRVLRAQDRHPDRGRARARVADGDDPGRPRDAARAFRPALHRRERRASSGRSRSIARSTARSSGSSASSPSTSRAPSRSGSRRSRPSSSRSRIGTCEAARGARRGPRVARAARRGRRRPTTGCRTRSGWRRSRRCRTCWFSVTARSRRGRPSPRTRRRGAAACRGLGRPRRSSRHGKPGAPGRLRSAQCRAQPPSTLIVWPVTKDASSEAR